MALLLNWFSFQRLPETISAFVKEFGSWEALNAGRPEADAMGLPYRAMRVGNAPALVSYGKATPTDASWSHRAFPVVASESTPIVNAVLEHSLAECLQERNFDVYASDHGLAAYPHNAPRFSGLDVRPGVEIYAFRPDDQSPYGAAINWDVQVRFIESLLESRLRSLAMKAPVVPLETGPRRRKIGERHAFAGILEQIGTDSGMLRTRTGDSVKIALKDYTLEATSRTLLKYSESAVGAPRRLLQEIQRIKFSLDEHGARNKNVLKDRLAAVRSVLSEPGTRGLTFTLCVPPHTMAVLGMQPFEIGSTDVHA